MLLFVSLTACYRQKHENNAAHKFTAHRMDKKHFQELINKIKTSDTYENPKKWEARGLNPSDQTIIHLLRLSTNKFLDKLNEIYTSNVTADTKLEQVSDLVDELPWDELDTEEKEFLADILSPAIEAAGFNPSEIF
jgi:hypothetical protein